MHKIKCTDCTTLRKCNIIHQTGLKVTKMISLHASINFLNVLKNRVACNFSTHFKIRGTMICFLQKYYSTRQGYIKACTSCGEPSWFNWRIVAPGPSDQYRIVSVSDCKRNTSFAVTLTRGTSVQNTFKPYYSRWVFKIMCTRGYDDSCLVERYGRDCPFCSCLFTKSAVCLLTLIVD